MKTDALLRRIEKALANPSDRRNLVFGFQKEAWNTKDENEPVFQILRDLALDLDYYEPAPEIRREDPSYYGDERLELEISNCLKRVAELKSR